MQTIRVECRHCGHTLGENIRQLPQGHPEIFTSDAREGDDFPQSHMTPGVAELREDVTRHYTYNEDTGESEPCGDPENVWYFAADTLPGTNRINESKGCCDYDHFDLVCGGCAAPVGDGNIDCWSSKALTVEAENITVTTL